MVELDESIRQSLLLLITTVPGERVMRPEYGCYLYRLIFSPNDYTTAGLAIHYVKQAIDRWEPRIEVVRLDAGQNPDDAGRLDILLEYRVRATQEMDRLTVSLNLTGEQP
jgi:phage baseplate assembly protein W